MREWVADLHRRAQVSQAANKRYLATRGYQAIAAIIAALHASSDSLIKLAA